jgi:hypothetical protein
MTKYEYTPSVSYYALLSGLTRAIVYMADKELSGAKNAFIFGDVP